MNLAAPLRVSLASLALLAVGCNGSVIGDIGPGGGQPGNGKTSTPGMSNTPDGTPSNPSSTPVIPSDPAICKSPAVVPGARVWRLTHRQLDNTLRDAFGFTVPSVGTLPGESRLDGFANASERLGISASLFDFYSRVANEVATEAVAKSSTLLGCGLDGLGAGSCLTDFLKKVGARAWRRPLSEDELGKLGKLYTSAAGDLGPEGGFKTLVQGLVLSTNFLFRTELGAGGSVSKLSDHEIASALSYMMWDGPPDARLAELAAGGKLADPATRATEAERLYKDPRASEAMFSFVQQWLETEDFLTKPKDMLTFPTFTEEVARDLEEETRTFIKGVFFDPAGDKTFKTMFTASWGYLNSRTAKLYGKDGAAGGTQLARVDLDPNQRRGLLTQGSFLAAHAEPVHTSVVARGRFMREEVLCNIVPPPPAEFKFDEKVITEDMTAREKFIEHSKNPACKACHALFDGLGFALENYDAVGTWRATEKGKTIDPSGTITLGSGAEVQFKNFVDLVDQLAGKTPDVYDCFSEQFLQYVSGRVKLDDCERATIARAFKDSGYRLDGLVKAIVTSASFVERAN